MPCGTILLPFYQKQKYSRKSLLEYFCFVRDRGIGLLLSVWKTDVLPLN